MASDDEDELAQLRAARGSNGVGSKLLDTLKGGGHRRPTVHQAEYFEADTNLGRPGSPAGEDLEDAEADVGPVLEEEAITEADLRHQFPLSFGEQEKRAVNLEQVHEGKVRAEVTELASLPDSSNERVEGLLALENEAEPLVGPVMPENATGGEEEDPYSLPVSHEVTMEAGGSQIPMIALQARSHHISMSCGVTAHRMCDTGHGKGVSCVDVDYSGSRLLSGSRDNSLRIFDFNGMKSSMQSFRQLEPSEGHPMLACSWSPTGDAFLAVSGGAQIKIYDRDGSERGESLRGDMYIRDQRNTKGHISPATGGHWHPSDRSTALTCSEDGTLRLWDTTSVVQKTVIKPVLQRAARVCVSACAYNSNGSSIAAGLVDGSIQVWDAKGSMGRSAAVEAVPVPKAQLMGKQDWRYVSGGAQSVVRGAHPPDTDITSLAFSQDNLKLLSRAADDTLKVWDLRKFKVPLHIFSNLPNMSSTTGVCFSPNDRMAVTGTSAGPKGVGGSLAFIDLSKDAVVRRIAMPSSVVAVHWSHRLNQIFVGAGDRSSGAVRVLYSPSLSERGVLLCAHRRPRAKDPFDFEAPPVIHTPHALPLFREPRGSKRHLDAKPKDAALRFKPDSGSAILQGTGTGGKIGATGGTLLTQFVLKNQGKLQNPREEDIRSKILRHTGYGDKKSELFSRAYRETQPERIFAEEEDEEEQKK